MKSWHIWIIWALLGQPWVWLLGMEAWRHWTWLSTFTWCRTLRYLTSPSAKPSLIWILPGLWTWNKLPFSVMNWDYYFPPTVFPHSLIHTFIHLMLVSCACVSAHVPWCTGPKTTLILSWSSSSPLFKTVSLSLDAQARLASGNSAISASHLPTFPPGA